MSEYTDVDTLIIDIETDVVDDKLFKDMGPLAPSKIECVAFCNNHFETVSHVLDKPTLWHDYINVSMPKRVVFHNGIRFDIPVLKRIWGFEFHPDTEIFDTMIAAKIIWPNRDSYSLESFAADYGLEKLDLSDLIARCKRDVEITTKLYKQILREIEIQKIPMDVFRLEFQVAKLVADQYRLGVRFDIEKANTLLSEMTDRMDTIYKEVQEKSDLVPIKDPVYPPKKQFKKDGTLSVAMEKYLKENTSHWSRLTSSSGIVKDAIVFTISGDSITEIRNLPLKEPINVYKKLDISSIQDVKDYLMNKGWEPTLWNYKKVPKEKKTIRTSPKLYDEKKRLCPNLELLARANPIVGYIAEYYSLRNRRSVLSGDKGDTGWLNNSRLKVDGRLCPDADTLGAATARFTHRIVANVPRVTSPYGREFRSLFKPPEGWLQVGWDATALEAVMEAHYTYNFDEGKYAEKILKGDIHTENMIAVGLKTRDDAKTFKYAITYGALAPKLAATFGWSLKEAQERYQAYWEANPALRSLTEMVTNIAKSRGYLYSIDGRKIYVDLQHTALNRLLQSAGAITMKYAMILSERMIRKAGATEEDAYGMIKYHDEEQWAATEAWAPTVLDLGTKSVSLAGRYLKLKVPLSATGKIGTCWADTH